MSDSLPLSLLNDYLYCPRRAAFKPIEGWWGENEHPVIGTLESSTISPADTAFLSLFDKSAFATAAQKATSRISPGGGGTAATSVRSVLPEIRVLSGLTASCTGR